MKTKMNLGQKSGIGMALMALALLFGCGEEGQDKKEETLFGVWSIELRESGGYREVTKLRLEKEKFTMDKECSFRGITTVATASSPSVITEREIEVKEAKSDLKTVNYEGGRLDCDIAFPSGKIAYELEDGKLLMKDPISGEPREYTKLNKL